MFLPRSIDKFRASLPGGDCGDYRITGLTGLMLERLGIDEVEMLNAVQSASSDDDIAAFVQSKASQTAVDAWNGFILTQVPRDGRWDELIILYPWLSQAPRKSLLAVDLLREDDRQTFKVGRDVLDGES